VAVERKQRKSPWMEGCRYIRANMETLFMGVESLWLPMSPWGKPESNESESTTHGDRV